MEIDRLMGCAHSVQVVRNRRDNDTSCTLELDLSYLEQDIHAGEFLMVWVPGVDEIPMSVSSWNSRTAGITVKTIGDATRRLASLDKGDWIGIRGPFGNHFSHDAQKSLVVGGGIGVAPLSLLIHEILDLGKEAHLLVGAKTKTELILNEFRKIKDDNFQLTISTDDGSAGTQGYATTVAEELVERYSFDKLYTCGPEIMMLKLHHLAKEHSIRFEASLERFMKCGCGICGTCAMDPGGELVCLDGPIFSGEELDRMDDFGQYYRDSTGQKIAF